MSDRLHALWLKIAGTSLIAFGLLGFLGTMPATSEPLRWGMDLLSWPLDGWPTWDSPETWFLSALSGGFLAGWGMTVVAAAVLLHPGAPEPVRRTYLLGVATWFIVDSSGSITSGNWENAVWNILVLAFLIGPLWRPATDTQKGEA